jgi:ribosomal protein L1
MNRGLNLTRIKLNLFKDIHKTFASKRMRFKEDFMKMKEQEELEENNTIDQEQINVGDPEEKNSESDVKHFSRCHRYLYNPNESLFRIRENYFEEQSYINFTLHLSVDYLKKDQKVKGYYIPSKRLDFNSVVCVVTSEKNRQIVENNNCVFADENIISQIKSHELSYNKIVFTADSLSLIDKSFQRVLINNNQFPDRDFLTLCQDEELDSVLNKFDKGLIEFKMNEKNIIECPIGMTGFTNKEILMNLDSLVKAIINRKPKSFRGMRYFKRGFISPALEKSRYFELDISSITPSSYNYFMNQKILDEDNVVKIKNIDDDHEFGKKSDDEFNLKI